MQGVDRLQVVVGKLVHVTSPVGASGDVLQNPPMIPGFQAALPVRVSFGDGVVSELRAVVAGRRVLVVVEEPVAGIPAVARAIAGMDVHAKPAASRRST